MSTQRQGPSREEVTGWLGEHGNLLFRYALKRIGDRTVAEDLVQDTFVAALRSSSEFEGRSKVETWLVGILRHKIADHMRRRTRERERESNRENELAPAIFHNGHWRIGLKAWTDAPSRSMESEEFWRVLQDCHQKLPAKLGDAFRMRDLEELPMAEICEILEITTTNLSVRLHRARVLLRECLDRNWFGTGRVGENQA